MKWLRWRDRYHCWACTLPEHKGCFWPCQTGVRLGMGCSRVSSVLVLIAGESWALVSQNWGRDPASPVRNLSSRHDAALPLNWNCKLSHLKHKESQQITSIDYKTSTLKISQLCLSNLWKYLQEKILPFITTLCSPFNCSSWQTLKSCSLKVSNCSNVV